MPFVRAAKAKARAEKENKYLSDKLKEKTKELDNELKSQELDYDDLHFVDGENSILGKGAFGIVRKATYHGEVSLRTCGRRSVPRIALAFGVCSNGESSAVPVAMRSPLRVRAFALLLRMLRVSAHRKCSSNATTRAQW